MALPEEIRTLRVVDRRELTGDTIELELEPADGRSLPAWEPGAHIDLRLGSDMIRQYSLLPSRSREDTWTVAVLVEEQGRGGSRLIAETLQIGSRVKVSGPRNHFPFGGGGPYLFIAGGIGITPFLAMCRAAEASGAEWRLDYLGRSRESMPYVDELVAEFGEHIELRISGEAARLDVRAEIAASPMTTQVYCCGPDRLMDEVEALMSEERIEYAHLERFRPRDADQSENFEFTVYAAASDIEFVVPADESILMAADFEGVVVPGDCLEGTCGSCETRVLLGAVEHRDSVLSLAQRRESATMMICVSRAKPGTDRLELDL